MSTAQTPAQLADTLKRPASDGYLAQRHDLLPEYIIVWAPCGCYWVSDDKARNASVTACATPSCDFKWLEVQRAFEALRQLELSVSNPPEDKKLGIHPVAADSGLLESEVEIGTSNPEGQTQDMISEGGPVESSLPEVPETH